MVVSPPPRFQFEGVPSVWSRPLPSSNVEFTQKLPGSRSACGARANETSSITITPVIVVEPPETKEQRILTAPVGTANDALRLVKVEFAIVLTQPGLLVPEVTKWVGVPTWLLEPSKNRTVTRISGALMLYISYHCMFKVSPGLA